MYYAREVLQDEISEVKSSKPIDMKDLNKRRESLKQLKIALMLIDKYEINEQIKACSGWDYE